MPDYRGGDAGRSGPSQSAVHNIATGNTAGERKRKLNQKIIMGLAQAGLVGATGVIKKGLADQEEHDSKKKIMADAIANAKKASGKQQSDFAAVRNSYPGGAEGPQEWENLAYTPKGGFSGGYQGYGSPGPEEVSKRGLAQDDLNKASAGAPVTWGGTQHFTTSGLEDHAANAEIAGSDHSYLKKLAGPQRTAFEEMQAKDRAMLDIGPSIGSPRSAGGDISRETPYNTPTGGTEVDAANRPERSFTGWAPTDEELSGMSQTKRGF